jgi:kinesin family member 13
MIFATGISPQFSNRNYQHQQSYPEPPEPIIEIVIQDNEETLPPPEPIVTQQDGKPKKEQVQVFYVKYKKDDNNKLVIGRIK